MSSTTISQHPFRWYATRISNLPDSGYVCFSRLRGFDKTHYPKEDMAIAARNDLNGIEKWEEHWTPSETEKAIQECDVYSEQTLNHLWIVGED